MWERTNVQSLLRNQKSGQYYGRFTVFGKQKWIAFKTDVFAGARVRLAGKIAVKERMGGKAVHVETGKAAIDELMKVHPEQLENHAKLTPSTTLTRIVARM